MPVVIKAKISRTTTNIPSGLADREIAINVPDKTFFFGNSSGGYDSFVVPPPGGGGGAAFTEVEIDFGALAVKTKKFTITDATSTAASKIAVNQSGKAATGRQSDENEFTSLTFSALPASGSFTLYAHCNNGTVSGKHKIIYSLI